MAITLKTENIGSLDGTAILVSYINLTNFELSPPPFEIVEWADRCVQVSGTFNGGTIIIEGSNDGATWEVLSDPNNNPLSRSISFIEQIMEVTRYVRPRVLSGTGVFLNAYFVLRRNSGMRT